MEESLARLNRSIFFPRKIPIYVCREVLRTENLGRGMIRNKDEGGNEIKNSFILLRKMPKTIGGSTQ